MFKQNRIYQEAWQPGARGIRAETVLESGSLVSCFVNSQRSVSRVPAANVCGIACSDNCPKFQLMWTVEAAHYSAASADYREMQKKCRSQTTWLDPPPASRRTLVPFRKQPTGPEKNGEFFACVANQLEAVIREGADVSPVTGLFSG